MIPATPAAEPTVKADAPLAAEEEAAAAVPDPEAEADAEPVADPEAELAPEAEADPDLLSASSTQVIVLGKGGHTQRSNKCRKNQLGQ